MHPQFKLSQPVRVRQYPLKKEDGEGISPLTEIFLQTGLLKECQSSIHLFYLLQSLIDHTK